MSKKGGGSHNNIRELIDILERNTINQDDWYSDGDVESDTEEEQDDSEINIEDLRLVIFATEGPFTQSFIPMLKQFEVKFLVTDDTDHVIDIFMNNSQIRHILIDMDRPTNPTKGMNIFADLKTINPNLIVHYCTKNPLSMESRNIQSKGAILMQKPILRKTVEVFVSQYFAR
ncbi:MAG: hypothetical protein FWE57_03545 [Chitinispirillia bacterium]|nr:hypothetical protein [Chitinispirillia bacterium]